MVAVTLAFACTPDDAPSPAAAFYAEVAVEVHPSPSDTLARLGLGDSRSIVRWWYAGDPVRWRWEVETVGTIIDDGVILWVGDGIDSWTYDDRSNIYQRQTVEGMPVGLASPLPRAWGALRSSWATVEGMPVGLASPLSFSAPVGPANVESIDAFTEQWRERGGDPEVAVAGEATVLGRPTQIVELRYSAGGLFRAFIDPERMFIMRWAVDGEVGGQSYRAEVTVLDYDTDIDAGRFTFEAPHDARETEALGNQSCSGSSGPLGTGAVFPREPDLLTPLHAPSGYQSTAAGGEGSAFVCARAVWSLLEGAEGGYILLRQRVRAGGIPQSARSWQTVDSNLDSAYRHSANGVVSLLWREGDIVALLDTDSVSFEELLRIAESATP